MRSHSCFAFSPYTYIGSRMDIEKGTQSPSPGKSNVDHMLLPLDVQFHFQWRFAQPRWHSSIHSQLAPNVPASRMISTSIFFLAKPSMAASVAFSVTTDAKCNQVVPDIPAELASRLYVVNLQVLDGTAVLASPPISFQHLISDRGVFFRLEFESWLLLSKAHRIRWAVHNELHGRVSSSLAPARKSAQIISRQ